MDIPSLEQTESFINEGRIMSPGPWVQHSFFVAKAAESIAQHHPKLDPTIAFILGYLHDIGRRVGITDMHHILDGYYFLKEKGKLAFVLPRSFFNADHHDNTRSGKTKVRAGEIRRTIARILTLNKS